MRVVFIGRDNSFNRKGFITIIDEFVFHLMCLTFSFDIFQS